MAWGYIGKIRPSTAEKNLEQFETIVKTDTWETYVLNYRKNAVALQYGTQEFWLRIGETIQNDQRQTENLTLETCNCALDNFVYKLMQQVLLWYVDAEEKFGLEKLRSASNDLQEIIVKFDFENTVTFSAFPIMTNNASVVPHYVDAREKFTLEKLETAWNRPQTSDFEI